MNDDRQKQLAQALRAFAIAFAAQDYGRAIKWANIAAVLAPLVHDRR